MKQSAWFVIRVMNVTTELFTKENNNNCIVETDKQISKRHVIVISRHFRENTYLISGKQNYKQYRTDPDIYIVAVTRNHLEDIHNFHEENHKIKFKIRKLKKTRTFIEETSESSGHFKKYLPRFQDGGQNITDEQIIDYNLNTDNNDEDTIVSSQHFTNSATVNLNFKTKRCSNNCDITPLFNFTPKWLPPRSPHALIEEEFTENPWALLVATIFLTKTTGLKAKPILWKFLRDFPDPTCVVWAKVEVLEGYFKNLGLVKRANMIQKMSREFLEGKWRNAGDLCGVGQYGEDAYRIFCLAETNFVPCDRYLRLYVDWLNHRDFDTE